MKHYNIDEFVWLVPRPKNRYAINFLHERVFNLNTALLGELGQQIDIAIHPTDHVICLRKSTGNNKWKVPRSGSIKSADLNEQLLAANFKPPLRFTVTRQDDHWIAVPEPVKVPDKVDVTKPSKRPRKVNPDRLLEGVKRT